MKKRVGCVAQTSFKGLRKASPSSCDNNRFSSISFEMIRKIGYIDYNKLLLFHEYFQQKQEYDIKLDGRFLK